MRANKRILALLAGCSSSIILFPAVSLAQSPSGKPGASTVEEVVVTGSRVITNGNNSPTPVTVVTTEQLASTTPSNVPDALNKLPLFSGSRGQQTLGNASQNSTGNFLNLRGVGIIRTLILFDGHRVPPTAADGTVDTNTIPQMLLQRVDVVTGGASAVYGSDAVTGVVNFVVDKKFNGLKAQGQVGRSGYGDDNSVRYGIAGGMDLFDGRGHLEGSVEHYSSDGIPSKLDRPAGKLVYSEEGAGTVANPFHLVPNTRVSTSSYGGLFRSGPLAGQQFVAIGVLGPFVHGAPSGSTGIESGGDGTYLFASSLLASLRSDQAYGRFDFDLTDNISFYAQGSFSRAENGNDFASPGLGNVVLSSSNPFLPASVRAALGSTPTFNFSKSIRNAAHAGVSSTTDNSYVNVGFTGSLNDNVKWDVSYIRGETKSHVINTNNTNNAKYYAALDAVVNPANGQIVCNVTLTNPGLYPNCLPLNPFGPNSEDPAAVAAYRNNTYFDLDNSMDDLSGTISGTPFKTWAGPVRVALSGEYHKLALNNVSTAQPTDHPSCVGLRFNCTAATTLYNSNVVADVAASESISEGAFEFNLPLLAEARFAESVDLNGAVRYASYSASGKATTWKLGLDWHVNSELNFRGTRSQDIRAPTLFDLFAPVNASPTGFTDIHTNTTGNPPVQSSGNPNLIPEVAQTITVGGVYRPSWLPGFSLTVDYYKISMANAITSVGGNNSQTQALCEASGGASPLCALYIRPLPFSNRTPANYPTRILTQGLNVSSVKTNGVDVEINYTVPVFDGMLSLRGLASYQPKLVTIQFPGAGPINAAGAAGLAQEKLVGIAQFTKGAFKINLQERWRSPEKQSGNPILIYSDPDIPAVSFMDLNLAYSIKRGRTDTELFLSVQNVLDTAAPVYVSTGSAANPGFSYPIVNGDDVVGRYFTTGFRLKF